MIWLEQRDLEWIVGLVRIMPEPGVSNVVASFYA